MLWFKSCRFPNLRVVWSDHLSKICQGFDVQNATIILRRNVRTYIDVFTIILGIFTMHDNVCTMKMCDNVWKSQNTQLSSVMTEHIQMSLLLESYRKINKSNFLYSLRPAWLASLICVGLLGPYTYYRRPVLNLQSINQLGLHSQTNIVST